jgi:glycosyltransferase involved in cell wall biosynthesis
MVRGARHAAGRRPDERATAATGGDGSPRRTLLVAGENRFVRAPDGRACSATGVDGHRFWARYLDGFERVLVLARVADGPCPPAAVPVEGPGVEVVAVPDYHGAAGWVRTRGALRQVARAAVVRADAILLRAPGAVPGAVWRLRGSRPVGVEVIGDPDEVLGSRAVPGIGGRIARRLLAHELRSMCRRAGATSYVTAETLQRRYPPGGWTISYSSIDLPPEAFATENEIRARAGTRTGAARHLVFVGTLAQLYKGPDVLIDAVAACRERGLALTLTMVGDGARRSWLEERAHRRGLGAAVRFAGHLASGALVREALDRADLFVLPSRGEGLPRAMIEAMARGVPALGTAVGGVAELLPPERVVAPDDTDGLAVALASLCAPSTDLTALGLRDLGVARRSAADVLAPRRRELYTHLAALVTPRREALIAGAAA